MTSREKVKETVINGEPPELSKPGLDVLCEALLGGLQQSAV